MPLNRLCPSIGQAYTIVSGLKRLVYTSVCGLKLLVYTIVCGLKRLVFFFLQGATIGGNLGASGIGTLGTQLNCFTRTKVQILTQSLCRGEPRESDRDSRDARKRREAEQEVF
jgi:hypothetical protein